MYDVIIYSFKNYKNSQNLIFCKFIEKYINYLIIIKY